MGKAMRDAEQIEDEVWAQYDDDVEDVDDGPEGSLIIRKQVTQDLGYFGVGEEMIVMIEIFNVGEGSAYDVTVTEKWPEDGFELVTGEATTVIDEIEAGGENKFNVTYKCLQQGVFDGFRADVTYAPTNGQRDTPRQAYSTGMQKMYILPNDQWLSYVKDRTLDYALLGALSLGVVVLPLLNYYNIESNTVNGYPKA